MVTLHPVFPVFLFLLFNIIHELHFFKNCNALFEEYMESRDVRGGLFFHGAGRGGAKKRVNRLEWTSLLIKAKITSNKLQIVETVSNHGNATDHITSRTLFPM